MVKNFKITVEYDGSAYHGWQRQVKDPTIQGEIEKVLGVMTNEEISLTGSGRTDAGVHALGQVANFKCRTKLDAQAFQNGLNSMLPGDIVIRRCERVDESFHSRYGAKRKTYQYRILNQEIPAAIGRQYTWAIKTTLDLDSMLRASKWILGTHDFKSFEGTGSPRSHTRRVVTEAKLARHDNNHIIFTITADGFLRYMVRNIVGTLVDVGLSKLTPKQFGEILNSKNRTLAGATAPPQGLFLVRVYYD